MNTGIRQVNRSGEAFLFYLLTFSLVTEQSHQRPVVYKACIYFISFLLSAWESTSDLSGQWVLTCSRDIWSLFTCRCLVLEPTVSPKCIWEWKKQTIQKHFQVVKSMTIFISTPHHLKGVSASIVPSDTALWEGRDFENGPTIWSWTLELCSATRSKPQMWKLEAEQSVSQKHKSTNLQRNLGAVFSAQKAGLYTTVTFTVQICCLQISSCRVQLYIAPICLL